jgi:4-amino-4-deoxychorismate lyase
MLLALAVTGRGVVDPGEPVVHADDEAVLRGRAAFETLRVYDGRPFQLGDHLERLAASAARIDLPATDRLDLERLGAAALEAAQTPNAVLRFLWTAGREDGDPLGAALVSAIPDYIAEWRSRGIRLVSLLGVRAEVPWLLGGVKATSYAVNMAADAEAKRRGADDAVFVDSAGVVLEGPVTNVWWRRGDTLCTPGLDLGVLAGVTRGVLITAAPRFGYRIEEGVFTLADVASADEVFTSSSVREVLPVVELDGKRIGDGAPGPGARALQLALRRVATHQ